MNGPRRPPNGPRLWLGLLVALATVLPGVPAEGQWVSPPESRAFVEIPGLRHETFTSPSMATEVGYSVVLPPGYEDSEARYPVVYWLHGGGGTESRDLHTVRAWRGLFETGEIQPVILVYPNGGRSGYMDHADGRTLVETMIIEELVPLVDRRYRTIPTRQARAVHGFSMGSSGALKFAIKYPDLFSAVVAWGGGSIDLERTEDPWILDILERNLGSDPELIRANNTYHFLEKSHDAVRAAGTSFLLVTGEDDEWLPSALDFRSALQQRGIPCELRTVPGVGHDLRGLMKVEGRAAARFQDRAFGKNAEADPSVGHYGPRQAGWLAAAEASRPPLVETVVSPRGLVRMKSDPAAFQGWRPVSVDDVRALYEKPLKQGDSVVLDFGRHLTGHLSLSLEPTRAADAPVRLRLTFGEVPAEVAEPFDPYPGELSRAWLQDEILTVDVLPATLVLPRRYAFRYLKLELVGASPWYDLRVTDVSATARTSAADPAVGLPPGLPERVRAIDEVSRATLRECMQTVFEDGPKRDRRLWIGDLRLQALTSYVSHRSLPLVKRGLYLLAGLARADGLVPATLFESPTPHRQENFSLDYALLFVPTLLDYVEASGDLETARDLWPVAQRQLELGLRQVGEDDLFREPEQKDWWLFFDWNPELDKQASMQGLIVFVLHEGAELAERVGEPAAVALVETAERMSRAARERLFDAEAGVFVSGPERQVSQASQAWMVLAGVVEGESARRVLREALSRPGTVPPKAPYLVHYVVEALFACGLDREAADLVLDYWGGMLDRGADTFWEVWDPDDERLSPYGSHLVNSYCHAWSCTPAWFIRTRPEAFRSRGAR